MKYLVIIDFKKPWNYIYFLPVQALAFGEVATKNEVNPVWWNLLEKVRTYYQQNPDFS